MLLLLDIAAEERFLFGFDDDEDIVTQMVVKLPAETECCDELCGFDLMRKTQTGDSTLSLLPERCPFAGPGSISTVARTLTSQP
jgi:hypothetical protein